MFNGIAFEQHREDESHTDIHKQTVEVSNHPLTHFLVYLIITFQRVEDASSHFKITTAVLMDIGKLYSCASDTSSLAIYEIMDQVVVVRARDNSWEPIHSSLIISH